MERWKQIYIDGIGTQYEISDSGRCRNINKLHWKTRGILKPKFNKSNGYYSYCIADPNLSRYRYEYAHRLVLLHFKPSSGDLHGNHIDGDKLNNSVDNLEWCTQQENMTHASATGLIGKPVLQYSLDGDYIGRFDSATQAEKVMGITARSISQSLLSGDANSQSGGYQWRFEDSKTPVNDISDSYKSMEKSMVQLDLNGNLIERFSHSTLAYDKIGKIDNGYLKRVATRVNNIYMGYRWKFAEDYDAVQS